jgi:hypothetical protein
MTLLADRDVSRPILLIYRASSVSAGIAKTSADQSIAWRHPRFVLSPDPCCEALRTTDSNSKALPATTNGSTQHECNTGFPASFASDLDAGTIGLVALIAVVAAVVAVLGAIISISAKVNKLGSSLD